MPESNLLSTELEAFLPALACPACGVRTIEVRVGGAALRCRACGNDYRRRDGLQLMCDPETERMAFATELLELGSTITQHDVVVANALYHNHAAGSYDEENLAVGAITNGGNARLREVFERLCAGGATGPMLDFGTGTGHLLTLAEGLFYPRVGIDISSGMLRQAQRKGHAVLVANALKAPVADASVGVVTCHSFLHHFKEPLEVLGQMVRVLRPGGWLIADWEPNRLGRPRGLSLLAAKLKHPEMWFRRLAYDGSLALKRTNEVAEYYEALHPGLDADEIAGYLTSLEMRVTTVFHSNARSAYKSRFRVQDRLRAVLDGRCPTDRHCSLHFMIIAQRNPA